MDKSLKICIYIIACALHEETPDLSELTAEDYHAIVEIAKQHSVSSMLAASLSYCREQVPDDVYVELEQTFTQNIRRLSLLDSERTLLLEYLERNQIWYMPLKGVILRELYPQPEMREMCDNDILYDVAQRDKVVTFFRERGYEVHLHDGAEDDGFVKAPVYNFEMHRELFHGADRRIWERYYKNIHGKLILDGENCYKMHFSDEDLYIYVMVHACKHLKGGGTGLRSQTDCYVYQNCKGDSLDWAYIEQEEAKLGILDEERIIRSLSMKLFGEQMLRNQDSVTLTNQETEMLQYIAESGTYGILAHSVENKLSTHSRLEYVRMRLFPNMEWYQTYAPLAYRYKVLIPFVWAGRAVFKPLTNREKVMYELRQLIKRRNRDSQ